MAPVMPMACYCSECGYAMPYDGWLMINAMVRCGNEECPLFGFYYEVSMIRKEIR